VEVAGGETGSSDRLDEGAEGIGGIEGGVAAVGIDETMQPGGILVIACNISRRIDCGGRSAGGAVARRIQSRVSAVGIEQAMLLAGGGLIVTDDAAAAVHAIGGPRL